MTSGADRAFPGSLSPMEAKGGGRSWSSRIPEFTRTTGASHIHSYRDAAERGRIEREKERQGERERGGPRRSVTMAPTSRYLTDRQYVMRKPLFFTEQQTSILKRSQAQEEPEQDKRWPGESTGSYHHHINMDYLTRPRDEAAHDRLNLSQGNISPSSASGEDLMSPLGVSDLRGSPYRDEPSFDSAYLGSRSGQRSHCSPPAEVRTPTSPLSPRLTSTLLSPTYTPHSRHLRPQRTELRLGGRGGGGGTGGESRLKVISSTGYFQSRRSPAPHTMSPTLHTMSPNQANYWACAVPKCLPPSPDRQSLNWDPDREYQELLDYTYPLRPGRVVSEWDGSDPQGASLRHTDSGLQDSGIELDRICSSASLSALDFSLSRAEHTGMGRPREGEALGVSLRSSKILGLSKSSDGLRYTSPLSPEDLFGLSLESLDGSKGRTRENQPSHNVGEGQRCQHHTSARSPSYFSSSTSFIRSTSILPRPGCVGGGDWDEDYRPLPDQLEELHALSRQVREVTAQINQPVSASWESLDPGTTSIYSSTPLREKQVEAQQGEASEKRKEDEADRRDKEERDDDVDREERGAHGTAQYFIDHGVRQNHGTQTQPVDRGVTLTSLREVEALVGQLSGLTFPEVRSQENQEQTDSLMQHIQVFCSNLGELVHWLYTVVERMAVLAPPTVDIESVKSSLAEYQSFQREMSAHHPLTSSVLDTGALLLSCMNSTSPVLRDTLLLIESQSKALESHTEHLFSSILSAMDSLTQPASRPGATASQPARAAQPSRGQEMRIGDSGIVGIQGTN